MLASVDFFLKQEGTKGNEARNKETYKANFIKTSYSQLRDPS